MLTFIISVVLNLNEWGPVWMVNPVAWMPHGYCFRWHPGLTWLHAVTDGLIAIAYLSIPSLMYLHRERATAAMRPLVLLFAAFILSCGIGHLLAAWNIWQGHYWVEGVWKANTAFISLATAWQLRRTLPQLMGMHQQLSEAKHLAQTDRLTGLKNRLSLEQAFQQLPLLEKTVASENVLMLVDLDNFKQINDTYGHTVGDEVLRMLAQLLRQHTRTADVVTRLGGDEFAILLVGCSLHHGYTIAETIRQAVAQLSLDDLLPAAVPQPRLTTSIGLTAVRTDCPLSEVLHTADQLLYASKAQGRNRVSMAPEATGEERSPLSTPDT